MCFSVCVCDYNHGIMGRHRASTLSKIAMLSIGCESINQGIMFLILVPAIESSIESVLNPLTVESACYVFVHFGKIGIKMVLHTPTGSMENVISSSLYFITLNPMIVL